MMIVTIDGPAGSGKSSLGRRLAHRLGYRYIDSGAMYRAVGWAALQRGIDLGDDDALTAMAAELRIEILEPAATGGQSRFILDGDDVSEQIRSPEAASVASRVAVVPGVREVLVRQQRLIGECGGVVMEGRDIGTVVFPDADVKFYLDADPRVRAERKRDEQRERGAAWTLSRVEEELHDRDRRDSTRSDSPLRPAPDAVVINTDDKDLDQLEAEMLEVIAEAGKKAQPQATDT